MRGPFAAALLFVCVAAMPCLHGTRGADGTCVCFAGWALRDCSVSVAPLPPVFAVVPPRFSPSHSSLFPQDDVLDVSIDDSILTLVSRASGTIAVQDVSVQLRGTEGLSSPSYHVSLGHGRRLFGVKSFGLKSSQDVDASLVRERLVQRFFAAMGCATPRETFARLEMNGTDAGLYVLQEQIDDDFFEARNMSFTPAALLFKMGDRRSDYHDAPKSAAANTTAGHAFLLSARQQCENGTTAEIEATLDIDWMLQSYAATAVAANRDSVVVGHNYYLFWPNTSARGLSVTYDMDRSLGQGPLPEYLYDWPLSFCTPLVPWCGQLLLRFQQQYRGLVRRLIALYVEGGHFAADLDVLDSVATQFRAPGNYSANIRSWMELRVGFLLNASGSTTSETGHTADSSL